MNMSDIQNLYDSLNRLYNQILPEEKLDERIFIKVYENFAPRPNKFPAIFRYPENNRVKF